MKQRAIIRLLLILVIIAVVVACVVFYMKNNNVPTKEKEEAVQEKKKEEKEEKDLPTSTNEVLKAPYDVTPFTIQEPFYVDGILIVNKKFPLPSTYLPNENEEAGNKVRELIADMQAQGYDINSSYSGYRSFERQKELYNNYVATSGEKEADTFSARPGYSEHQSGLTFDILHRDGTLVEKEAEAKWLLENAHKYGFIVRYQPGKEHITGFMSEPWHLRYIGDKAADIMHSGKCLEEYLNVEGGEYQE